MVVDIDSDEFAASGKSQQCELKDRSLLARNLTVGPLEPLRVWTIRHVCFHSSDHMYANYYNLSHLIASSTLAIGKRRNPHTPSFPS